MNQETIISAIKNGDERVFEHIYKEYYARLYSYIYGYVRNNDDTREILQNTFMALWEKKKELQEDTKIYAWLFTVVKNLCLNYIRDKQRKIQFESNSQSVAKERLYWQMRAMESFIPEEVTLSEIRKNIQNAVDKMPGQCRQIFLLSRNEGLSHSEISQKLNISIKTVENQITKALKILRIELSEYQYFILLIIHFLR